LGGGGAHITGQLLIVLHQLLILLVHSQHLADPVGRCLCLEDEEDEGDAELRGGTFLFSEVKSDSSRDGIESAGL